MHSRVALKLLAEHTAKRISSRMIAILALAPEHTDASTGRFFDAIETADLTSRRHVEDILAPLGFDFSVVVIKENEVYLISGPRNFMKLYFQINPDSIRVQDFLPEQTILEKAGCLNPLAVISQFGSRLALGPFEVCRTTDCINRDWRSVPNGHVVRIAASRLARGQFDVSTMPFDNIWNGFFDTRLALNDAVECARTALVSNLRIASKLGAICCEASGGIDSGILLSLSRHTLGSTFIGGISCDYPFFEFSREREYRARLYEYTGTKPHYESWEQALPFARCDGLPMHDSPSVDSTNWSAYNCACTTASRAGAATLLTGHGGDRVFLQDPFRAYPLQRRHERCPKWLPKKLYEASMEEATAIHRFLNIATPDGIAGEWHGALFEPGWAGRYGLVGSGLKRYRSGYLDRDFVRAMASVWLAKPDLSKGVQKPIAQLIFHEYLPDSTWCRASKVNHLGIVYRGARFWKHQMISLSRTATPVLEAAGIDPKRFLANLDRAGNGHDSVDLFVTLALSLVLWAASNSPREEKVHLELEFPLPVPAND
ncbi:MAG: asparagine synthase-related protein [Xanthobacteraceae bacterium]